MKLKNRPELGQRKGSTMIFILQRIAGLIINEISIPRDDSTSITENGDAAFSGGKLTVN